MTGAEGEAEPRPVPRVSLGTIAKEWLRLGCIGFGGPPTHIVLLRRMCVEERHWIEAQEFEDAIATTNLLPGPASTQLAIYCAWRLRGHFGAVLEIGRASCRERV
jgi:chromate transporter